VSRSSTRSGCFRGYIHNQTTNGRGTREPGISCSLGWGISRSLVVHGFTGEQAVPGGFHLSDNPFTVQVESWYGTCPVSRLRRQVD
jgi:hypothetical protein